MMKSRWVYNEVWSYFFVCDNDKESLIPFGLNSKIIGVAVSFQFLYAKHYPKVIFIVKKIIIKN